MTLSTQDRYKLAGETGVSRPTIDKWLRDPSTVIASVRYALEQGCKRLKLEPNDSGDNATR